MLTGDFRQYFLDADHVNVEILAGASYDDLQNFINFFGQRTILDGGVVTATSPADGTVAMASCKAWAKESDVEDAIGRFFDFAGIAGIALTNKAVNYIHLDYNGGTPQIVVTTDILTHDLKLDHVHVATVFRNGNDTHIRNMDHLGIQGIMRPDIHHKEEAGVHRASGAVTSSVGTRQLAVTAGVVYEGLSRGTTNAFNTSTGDTFSYWWTANSGTDWTEVTGQTAISNTQYNDITSGLVNLSAAAKRGVHWVYLDSDGSHIHVVYGQDNYSTADAESAGVPATVPALIANYCVLIAKIIVQKDQDTLYIAYPWTEAFQTSLAADHGSLAGLGDVADHPDFLLADGSRNLTGNLGVDAGVTIDGVDVGAHVVDDDVHDGTAVNLETYGSPTYDDVQDFFDLIVSKTVISGGAITDAGSGKINVASGTTMVRQSATFPGTVCFMDFGAASDVVLTDQYLNYIFVLYTGGAPVVGATTNVTVLYADTYVVLGAVWRDGTTLHMITMGSYGVDVAGQMTLALFERYGISRVTGMMITSSGRNIAITAGVIYGGVLRSTSAVFNSSGADTFSTWYYDGDAGPAVWVETASQSLIDNLQYNDVATGLATLTNAKYGVHWVYVDYDGGHVHVVYGVGDYTAAEAAAATVPASLPPVVSGFGILAGKIIILKSAGTMEATSPFTVTFTSALATDHGSLGGLADVADHAAYLLMDGSRNLEGNMAVDAGVTIDGVDISVDCTNNKILAYLGV